MGGTIIRMDKGRGTGDRCLGAGGTGQVHGWNDWWEQEVGQGCQGRTGGGIGGGQMDSEGPWRGPGVAAAVHGDRGRGQECGSSHSV